MDDDGSALEGLDKAMADIDAESSRSGEIWRTKALMFWHVAHRNGRCTDTSHEVVANGMISRFILKRIITAGAFSAAPEKMPIDRMVMLTS